MWRRRFKTRILLCALSLPICNWAFVFFLCKSLYFWFHFHSANYFYDNLHATTETRTCEEWTQIHKFSSLSGYLSRLTCGQVYFNTKDFRYLMDSEWFSADKKCHKLSKGNYYKVSGRYFSIHAHTTSKPCSIRKIIFGFMISSVTIPSALMGLIFSVHEPLEKLKCTVLCASIPIFPNSASLTMLLLLLGQCCRGGVILSSVICIRINLI
jgi:hypothetical protein